MNTMRVPPQVNVITLGARDLGKLKKFYAGLGWPFAFDSENFAAFETRGAVLALFPLDALASDGRTTANAPETGLRGFTLGILAESREEVDAMIEEVRRNGGRVTKEPVEATEFEGRSAYFADPEDNYWEIAYTDEPSPVAAAIRRAMGKQP